MLIDIFMLSFRAGLPISGTGGALLAVARSGQNTHRCTLPIIYSTPWHKGEVLRLSLVVDCGHQLNHMGV